jgi:enoyl-CoA hydratase/carnithine racemase
VELKTIRYDIDRRVATITLDRPHRHNAWTGRMHTEYRWVLDQAEHDDGVRVIIVTGAGEDFCVGADSQALEGHVSKGGYDPGTPDPLAEPGYGVHSQFDAPFAYHFGLTKPVIAAVNGRAAGVGMVLPCYADLRFASDDGVWTAAHGRLGFSAEYGLSWLLPRLIGLTRANDLLLTSRRISSIEAAEIGLVNAALPRDKLLPHVRSLAADMVANNSRRGLAETKRTIYLDQHRDAATAVRESERLLGALMREPDYARGVKALLERRSPDFE